ncbi:MAG: hypothetical protein AB7T49_18900 [Oligoflexales bacterium]
MSSASEQEGAELKAEAKKPEPVLEETVREELDASARAVDVVFVVDTSGSMGEEIDFLEKNMTDFFASIKDAGINVKITAIGGVDEDGNDFEFPNTLSASDFAVIKQHVDSHDAIAILSNYYSGKYEFPLALRENAVLEAVIISDDDGEGKGNEAGDFKPPSGRTASVNAIVGLEKGKHSKVCEIANKGDEHMTLAKNTEGEVLDICSENWSDLLKTLSKKIISRTGYKLKQTVDVSKDVKVNVGSRELKDGEFTIDEGENSLSISADVVVNEGDKIVVEYYPKK